ncbi:MAG: tetratricopeptide repeat protein [Candidatus Eiseniibacteriota bacterium]
MEADEDRTDLLRSAVAGDRWDVPALSFVGRVVGPYRILEHLGSGGMGTVYLAERADEHFQQRVALKILRAEASDRNLRDRFHVERQLLARLQHPKIARLYDGGVTEDGRPWFAMEHVIGRVLDRHCIEENLPIARRVELLIQVCEAVQYAHANMIVHRDLKPSNILVTPQGEVRLLDFGIAKPLELEEAKTRLTRTGGHVMTPEYASPEQVRGEPISAASDVYSLGVVLYRVLVDRPPYHLAGLTPAELERVVCEAEPPPPSSVASDAALRRTLSGDLDTIALKALAKAPQRRYASVEALADDLRRYLDGRPVLARPDSTAYRVRKFVRRHRWAVTAAAAVVLSLLAGVAGTSWQAEEARAHAETASMERDRAQRVSEMLVKLFEGTDPGTVGPEAAAVRGLLDRGRERMEADLEDDPAVRATLALTMGRAYRNLGVYADAETLLTKALGERRALAGGAGDASVAEVLCQLGNVLLDLGRVEEAGRSFREALDILNRDSGANRVLVSNLHQGLGAAHQHLAELDSAIAHYEVAVGIVRGDPERFEPHDLAIALSNLGAARHHAGDLVAADSLLGEAVEIHDRRPTMTSSHATALNNLASLRAKQGDHAAAETLLRKSLTIREQVFGEGHPLVAASRNNLASILQRQGKHDEAERLHRQALADRRAAFGDVHTSVAHSLNNLGIVLRNRGDLAGAEPLLRESLDIRRKLYPEAHPELARGAYNLGQLVHRLGRTEEAERLYREALEMRRTLLGERDPDTIDAAASLGKLLAETGRAAEADALAAAYPNSE